jgi:glycosyltransferase involved in cell wall biosynthesis
MTSKAQVFAAKSRPIFIAEVEAFGGAERSCLALSQWLHEQRVPHHFLLYRDGIGLQNYAGHPIAVHTLDPQMKAMKKFAALRRYRAQFPSDYKWLASGYQAAMHATIAGARGFHTLMHDTPSLFSGGAAPHGAKAKAYRRISDMVTGYGLRSGGQTIVTSEYLRDESRRVFGVEAAIARMGGVSGGSAAPEFRLRPMGAEFRMLSLSRIESNKRLDWMLRSMSELERRAPALSRRIEWGLDIVGKGSQMDALRAMAADLGIAERVRFHGFVSDAVLEELYAKANLFLMPAVQGYGIPAIEALQRGIPILLHRDSGVSDILLDTPWATVVRGGEQELTAGMAAAIDSAAALRHRGAELPDLPSEAQWAERVARLCNWL